jgi:hypothetical protein
MAGQTVLNVQARLVSMLQEEKVKELHFKSYYSVLNYFTVCIGKLGKPIAYSIK